MGLGLCVSVCLSRSLCVRLPTILTNHHINLPPHLGVYFEANGHGTVLFSDPLAKALLLQVRACVCLRKVHVCGCGGGERG